MRSRGNERCTNLTRSPDGYCVRHKQQACVRREERPIEAPQQPPAWLEEPRQLAAPQRITVPLIIPSDLAEERLGPITLDELKFLS